METGRGRGREKEKKGRGERDTERVNTCGRSQQLSLVSVRLFYFSDALLSLNLLTELIVMEICS